MNRIIVSVTGPSYPYSFTWEVSDIRSKELDIQLYFKNPDEIGLWDVSLILIRF